MNSRRKCAGNARRRVAPKLCDQDHVKPGGDGEAVTYVARDVISSAPMREIMGAITPIPHTLTQALDLKYRDFLTVVLIGKDGGEKLRQTSLLQPERLFQVVDSMPMRRAGER